MTDINLLKKSLSRRGQRPALSPEGTPFLTRTNTTPGVVFISAEQLVDELAKIGKAIDHESLIISDAAKTVAAPIPAEKPAKVIPATAPTTTPPIVEVWTIEELEALPWSELRTLAKDWDDVHGNKGKEHILAGMTGKPKKVSQ